MVAIRYRKDRKCWQVDYREDGRRHRPKFTSEKNAQEFREMKENELERKRAGLSFVEMVTFDKWADIFCRNHFKYKSPGYRQTTEKQIKYSILPFFTGLQMYEITKATIQDYVDFRTSKGVAPKTIQNEHGLISIMFVKAIENRYALDNPCVGVEMPVMVPKRQSDVIPPHHLKDFLREAKGELLKGVLIMVNTGLRTKELFQIKVKDFDPTASVLYLKSEMGRTTKNYKPRFIPVPAFIFNLFAGMGLDEPVMSISRKRFYKHFLRLRDKLNQSWCLHETRHTWVSLMAKNGIPSADIQEWAGHSNNVMTRRYTHYIQTAHSLEGIGGEFSKPAEDLVTIRSPRFLKNSNYNYLNVGDVGIEPCSSKDSNNLANQGQASEKSEKLDKIAKGKVNHAND